MIHFFTYPNSQTPTQPAKARKQLTASKQITK